MILPINNKYRISADSTSWAVQKRKGKKWGAILWFTSLESAIKELTGLMLRTSDAETLNEALEETRRITETLTLALTPAIDKTLIENATIVTSKVA